MNKLIAIFTLAFSLNALAIDIQCLQEAEFDIQNHFRTMGQDLNSAYPATTLSPGQEYRGGVFTYTNNFDFNLHIFAVSASSDFGEFDGMVIIDEPTCEIVEIIVL